MVRPVIAQYYRRGCRRNFCSSGSNNNGDVVDRGFKEVARSVMTTCYNYGIGLGFGYGSAFILVRIFGGSNAERSKEIEWEWENKQRELAEFERVLEWNRKNYGMSTTTTPSAK